MLAGLTLTETAAAIDLGDLTVSPNRIPDWYPFDETVKNASSQWTTIDATCTSSPCGSGHSPIPSTWGCSPANAAAGNLDSPNITCMLNNAPNNTVIFLPSGTYDTGDNKPILFQRSNVALRCEDASDTTILVNHSKTGSAGGCSGQDAGALAVSACTGGYQGNAVNWVGGFADFETQLTLSDASGFSVGDWIITDMDGSASCGLVDNPLNGTQDYFHHISRIVSKNGNQITIDRGLRMHYDNPACSARIVSKYTPLENIGLEDCRIETTAVNLADLAFRSAVSWTGVVNSWITGNHLKRWNNQTITFRRAARNWIQGNRIENVKQMQYNTTNIGMRQGAVDNIIENNYCTDSKVCIQNGAGAEGNVVAYNYLRQANGERSIYNHGNYTREILIEGNDADARIVSADIWWGRHGPRITAFRNRVVGSGRGAFLAQNRDGKGSKPVVSTEANWIGNIAAYFMTTSECLSNFPSCMGGAHDFDYSSKSFHIEKNIYRDATYGFQQDSPQPDTNCATGIGNCPGTNVDGDASPASWGSDRIPPSLYRTAAPSWWCQEACDWDDVHAGIGAWGDDFRGSLCKLPAQILAEGSTCTPLQGVPAPPVLLP